MIELTDKNTHLIWREIFRVQGNKRSNLLWVESIWYARNRIRESVEDLEGSEWLVDPNALEIPHYTRYESTQARLKVCEGKWFVEVFRGKMNCDGWRIKRVQ